MQDRTGKTTFAREFLANYADCKNFVNADLIAQGTFSPETAALRAGRAMLGEMLRKLKSEGYEIHLFFLWLKSVDLALSRVKERVSSGGHDVPEPIIRRRFDRSMRNFLLQYRSLAKVWTILDNSGEIPNVIAFERDGTIGIMDKSAYSALVKRYGRT